MEVVSNCPLAVASRAWSSADGSFALTVVCKGTFLLAPGESDLHRTQDPPNEEDAYWDDDDGRSLVAASEVVPGKAMADVIVVGDAFAKGKRPARSIVARIIVGEIDKSIEAFCDRAVLQTGELVEGSAVTQVPLVYERAAGGPGTENPVGISPDEAPDAYGMVALPTLQPPGAHVAYRGDFIAPIGFGPIAPSWPSRVEKLGRSAAGFRADRWHERVLPPGLDPAFFNVAPRDQQLREIRSNERIVLENLHRDHERLVTSLPGMTPLGVIERAGGARSPLSLRADTLTIDTVRGVCTVVWRGHVPLSHPRESGRVVITLEGWQDPTSTAPAAMRAVRGPAIPFPEASRPRAGEAIPGTPFKSVPAAPRDREPPEIVDTITEEVQIPRGLLTYQPPPAPHAAVPPAPPAPVAPAPVAPAPVPPALVTPPPMAPVPAPPPMIARPMVALGYGASPAPIAPVLQPPAPVYHAPLPIEPYDEETANEEREEEEIDEDDDAAIDEDDERDQDDDEERDQDDDEERDEDEEEEEEEADLFDPSTVPIEKCAALTAKIAMDRAETGAILEAEELNAARWAKVQKHWDDAMSEERGRGKTTLRKAFDEAYVASVEQKRGPIQLSEYARLVVATERGKLADLLGELKLPKGAPMRIERVWFAKMLTDAALAKKVREAIAAEKER
jgi:hypothetical protein